MSLTRTAPLFVLLAALAGCRGPTTKPIDKNPPPPDPKCNDGHLDPGEDCDLSDLNMQTCQSLGFDFGQLACSSDCRFSTSLCVKKCGNGMLDTGEACDGALGLSACGTFGYQACTQACAVDLSHCVNPPFDSGPGLDQVKGGPTALGDLPPPGVGDLVMAVPAFSRVETFPWNAQLGFDPTQGRKLSFQHTPAQVAVADVDGDGRQDVAAVDDQGAIDFYRYNGSGFTPSTVPDAGCAGGRFVGAGRFDPDAGQGLLLAGCPGGALVATSVGARSVGEAPGAALALADVDGDGLTDVVAVDGTRTVTLHLAPGFGADGGAPLTVDAAEVAAADLDGDGDVDLVALDGTNAYVLENTGTGFGLKQTIPAPGASGVAAADVDLDGQVDLFWLEADAFVVRRNRGQFLFSEYRTALPTPAPGTRLSASLGDLDGDGDLDVVVTWSLGGDATRTLPYLNRVR